jgi:hypothetical protein
MHPEAQTVRVAASDVAAKSDDAARTHTTTLARRIKRDPIWFVLILGEAEQSRGHVSRGSIQGCFAVEAPGSVAIHYSAVKAHQVGMTARVQSAM